MAVSNRTLPGAECRLGRQVKRFAPETLGPIALHQLGMALAVVVLASCAVGPSYHKPDAHLPAAFAPQQTSAAAQPAAGESAGKPAEVDFAAWWLSFHDAELESLIERAVKANPDILI